MKIIGLDTEHSYGIMKPWDEGFYLTVACIIDWQTKEKNIWWFEHNELDSNYPTPRQCLDEMQNVLNQYDLIVIQNLKHDMDILRHMGLDFENIKLWCTQEVDYLINGSNTTISYSLEEILKRRNLGHKKYKDEMNEHWNAGIETKDIPIDLVDKYVTKDVEESLMIYDQQKEDVINEGMTQLIKLRMEFIRCLSDMEINGIKWDTSTAEQIIAENRSNLDEIERSLLSMIGTMDLNLKSNKQLSAALYGGSYEIDGTEWIVKEYKYWSKYAERQCKIVKTIEGLGFTPINGTESKDSPGVYSVAKDTIKQLKCRTANQRKAKKLLLKHSELNKISNTLKGKTPETGLINKIKSDGLIHTNYNTTVTANGGLSSSDPNSQNLPREGTSPIKKCIVSRFKNGKVVENDLDQIEWRGAAHSSGDKVMINEINSGIDQHCATGEEIFKNEGERVDWKIFNFRMIYGGSAIGYYLDPKMPAFSMKKWYNIHEDFYYKYEGLKDWQDKNVNFVINNGYLQIETGRKFVFHKNHFDKRSGIWTYNDRAIKNYPVSGLARGDILPLLAVLIRKGMKAHNLKALMILTAHDSLVFDTPLEEVSTLSNLCIKVCSALPKYIEQWFGFKWKTILSGEVKYGNSYGQMEGF